MVYVAKIMSNELKGKKGAVDQVKNPELIKKIEKNIGDLVHLDNFDAEVMIEGTDAVVLLFSSSADHPAQDMYVDAFIDCKSRFKRMRNRSVRFYAVDLNTDYGIRQIPEDTHSNFPELLLIPAYHKATN